MKNVLCLPRYERLGSSSRVRFYQFFSFFKQTTVKALPLLGNDYIETIYSGHKVSLAYLLRKYLSRMWLLLFRPEKTYWIEKELFPFFPFWFENLFFWGKQIVVDYDDATFHIYDQHPNVLVRKLLGRKIDKIMARADTVLAGNSYIAERARAAGAKQVVLVPSVIDLSRYALKEWKSQKPVVIGWIGSPSSQNLLEGAFPALEAVAAQRQVIYQFVGVKNLRQANFVYEAIDWHEHTEVATISQFDIGIMPVEDQPFHQGKCGFKLIQYLACGIPIVGSPVGVNKDIIVEAENGYAATNETEWVQALLQLIDDPQQGIAFGKSGRKMVETHYCIEAVVPEIERALQGGV